MMMRQPKRPTLRPRKRRYHHGDLPPTLLKAAEVVLKRDGLEQLSLRAVAREAGVSHTAPQHHFGDLAGLLSELAAIGFGRFRDTMLSEVGDAQDALGDDSPAHDPLARGRALGRGYLRFARENPGLFLLMFRSARLDMKRPALRDAADAAFAVLAGAQGVSAPDGGMTLAQAASVAAAWAFVHGLAFLSLDKRLVPIVAALPSGLGEEDLLHAALDGLLKRIGTPPPAAPAGVVRRDT